MMTFRGEGQNQALDKETQSSDMGATVSVNNKGGSQLESGFPPVPMQETQEMWAPSLSWKDPLEEGLATHSRVLAYRIPMQRETWWATVHGSQRVGHD